ncbi:MAG: fused MFS/spermidine synthase [Caulobacter sp.]|nr:fused MFS/spermidine synthase [Caulobacter sp.]
MTAADTDPRSAPGPGPAIPWIFVLAVFCGAAMVFMVQPMVAKLVLPRLGGAPQVWNTSMAFFQAALLVGYGYAHLLQKVPRARDQVLIHLGVMMLAATILPLRITSLLGEPSTSHPALWLLGVLTLSIGAPFAALSATAPLVQAWHARVHGREGGAEPWALYAASNLGSLLALLAYPIAVEPTLALGDQRWGWSGLYIAFIAIIGALAMHIRRQAGASPATAASPAHRDALTEAEPISWRQRLTWIALAALPSSLMLGVTLHLSTDVASAPFLWVAPLSLYLLTFVIAFQTRPRIQPQLALMLMSTVLIVTVATLPFGAPNVLVTLALHLGTFFFCALVCHQALVARRPDPARLTDFYLCMSIGGVIGGAFNAFVAPAIFETVFEYGAVLCLCALVRPLWPLRPTRRELVLMAVAAGGTGLALIAASDSFWRLLQTHPVGSLPTDDVIKVLSSAGVIAVAACGILVRARALPFFASIVLLAFTANAIDSHADAYASRRSFFGVVHLTDTTVPGLGGPVRILSHGTTLHGAQARSPEYRCRPLVYYAPETPIGQVFRRAQTDHPAISVAAVGLGTGAVAAYVRPSDRLTFFEIDPQVVAISSDPANFSYTTECAKGPVDYVLGDARLTLEKQADGLYDILLVDAFSSDAIPAHLLTVEALRGYLARIKPDGVVILHLSNRHLELVFPAASAAKAAGGYALFQAYAPAPDSPTYQESAADVMIVGRNRAALEAYRADPRWLLSPPPTVRPWTDDYTNLVGALIGNLDGRRRDWQAAQEEAP